MNLEVAKGRIPLAFLSLVIALALWVYVQRQNAAATPDASPLSFVLTVQPKNLDTVHLNLVRPLGKVTVTTRLTPEQKKHINTGDFSAHVDLTGATEGEKSYPIAISGPLDMPVKIQADRETARVVLESIITKTVAVHIETRNSPGETGMIFIGASSEPSEVSVQGPRSEVDSVAYARALIDLSKVTHSVMVTQPVDCVDANHQFVANLKVDPPSVSVRPSLSPAPVAKTVLVNAQFTGQPEFGYRVAIDGVKVEPNKIEVEGTSEAMARLTGILNTLPIDISGLHATHTFETRVDLPPGLRVKRADQIRVTVVIEGPSVGNGH